ncbi:DedA family protein [Flaviflexus salsibiostraticola]|uniref:DedA family protein n=1 Tax=Flaviflexus salsibiostraticola TaxID=1282737 RepID=A0A3Q8WTY4_9ACTO|nr:DedA family protein [Flaviflexus salsibiostraticola]AZN30229.1 DedA family protein [Flaviflexus salsibiostraticola]
MQQELTGIAGWAVDVMETLGGFGAFLLIGLENLFPPLPSEIILPLAGFTASVGTLGLVEMIIWCTAGSVVGAWALYGVGAALGRERTRRIMGALPLVNVDDIVRTEAWFDRHGKWTVFLGRMIPIFRSLISIPAGVTRMRLAGFTALTLGGSLIWNTILIGAGYALGENWHVVEDWVSTFSTVVAIIVLALLIWWVARRSISSIKAKNGTQAEATEAPEHESGSVASTDTSSTDASSAATPEDPEQR